MSINLKNLIFVSSVPLAPTNFRVTNETTVETGEVMIIFQWDPIIIPHNMLFQHDSLQLSILPGATLQPVEVTSSFMIVLANDTEYEANLTIANCAGRNSSILHLVTSKIH